MIIWFQITNNAGPYAVLFSVLFSFPFKKKENRKTRPIPYRMKRLNESSLSGQRRQREYRPVPGALVGRGGREERTLSRVTVYKFRPGDTEAYFIGGPG